ncbi:nSTAND1 domain-containing NTPase [Saccharothrix syringae]|uniref:nSTAND1 domain-containing NTPase n=1 Tax=Saccharothrix syringae TaxID=103733 RepID=UPI00068DC5ED|nr:helix-turn-helix domain-containing protein [Saccharothrix syringae]
MQHGTEGEQFTADPAKVRTKSDFARELSALRALAGRTVREVAKDVGVPYSTAGGYFSGRHLPPLTMPHVLRRIIQACGVTDPEEVDRWLTALHRVRRRPGPRPRGVAAPYRGLESFQPEHAAWFHGRERLTAELTTLTARQWPGGNCTIVVGPSGSGKSSLLRAGLVSRFQRGEHALAGDWTTVLMTPGQRPLAQWEALVDQAPVGPRLVVVDQFEELFTLCADVGERQEFIARCARAAREDPSTLVVLGLRADFYPQAARHTELVSALQDAQVVVGPMTADEVRSAIVEPARQARLEVDDGFVELLMRDLAPIQGAVPSAAYEAGALPLLSHALLATWQRSSPGRLTIADYRATGGISGAIAHTADAAYAELDARQQTMARHLFLRLVRLGDQSADTRRRVPYAEILPEGEDSGELADVLDLFVERRLITVDTDTVEITHEALLTAWPRLRRWIDADRAGLEIHRRLTDDAHVWSRAQRDSGVLYRGVRLEAAREWSADTGHSRALNAVERAFLDASVAAEEADRRSRRRRARQLRRLVAALSVLVLIVAALAVYVFRQRTDALRERDAAISRQVAGDADNLRGSDVALASQLALAAYRISPTVEARSSLLDTTANASATRVVGQEGVVQAVAVAPGRDVIAAGGADTTVRIWRLTDRPSLEPADTPLGDPEGIVYSLAFDPSGTLLAAAGADRVVRLWDVTDPDHPASLGEPLSGPTNTVYSVAFSPDGRVLAAGSADNRVHLWEIGATQRPTPLPPLEGAADYVHSVAFSPDGRTVAAGGADGTLLLWDVTDPRRATRIGSPLVGPTRKILTVAFSPDGKSLIAGSSDKNLYLWRLSGREVADAAGAPLGGAASWINAVAFSPDGSTLASGSSDNTVVLRKTSDWAVTQTLTHPGPITTVAYLDGGETLATGAADGTVRLWAVPGPVITDSRDGVFNVQFNPTGTLLATGSGAADGAFRIWDVSDRQRPRIVGTPMENPSPGNRFIGALDMSSDGRTLAAGGLDSRVQLWDIDHPDRPTPMGEPLGGRFAPPEYLTATFGPRSSLLAVSGMGNVVWLWDITDRTRPRQVGGALTGPTNHVYSIAFSPDGTTLAAGSLDKTVWLWDVHDLSKIRRLGSIDGPVSYVHSVAFSPDSRTLAVGSADKTVRLWDMTDQSRPRAIGDPITGPSNYVYAVEFSPDGRMLAAGSADRSVWLWNVADRARPSHFATLTAATGAVHSVKFSPDGSTIAAASADQTARLWAVSPDAVADMVCETAGEPLSPAEWSQYIPGLPHRQVCG